MRGPRNGITTRPRGVVLATSGGLFDAWVKLLRKEKSAWVAAPQYAIPGQNPPLVGKDFS